MNNGGFCGGLDEQGGATRDTEARAPAAGLRTGMAQNPVIPGCFPDPSVCRVGDDVYLACSSFHQFPGIPLFHSRDLVHWRAAGHALSRASQLDLSGCPSGLGIFAPTLRYHLGRFWIVSTHVGLRRNFVVNAERIEGPWSDPLWLDWPGIDPSLCFLGDGRVIISGNGGFHGDEPSGLYQAEIDLGSGTLRTPRRLVWTGSGGHAPEGPHLFSRGGWFYLLAAEGGTEYGHMVTVARSCDPMGPFEACPHNPVLSHRSRAHPLQATGHADLLQMGDGRWYALLLGIRPAPVLFAPQRHHLGREVLLAPVAWSDDDWPVIGAPAGTVPVELAPDLLPVPRPWPEVEEAGAITPRGLGPEWVWLRNPVPGAHELGDQAGVLTLHGQSSGLDGTDGQAFVGLRLQQFVSRTSVRLRFDPDQEGDEAGLVLYKSEQFHYELAVSRHRGERVLLFRRRLGTLWRVERRSTCNAETVWLRMSTDARLARFLTSTDGEHWQVFGEGECGLLATEVTGGFTGVLIGLYAQGAGRPCNQAAHFDKFVHQTEGP